MAVAKFHGAVSCKIVLLAALLFTAAAGMAAARTTPAWEMQYCETLGPDVQLDCVSWCKSKGYPHGGEVDRDDSCCCIVYR